MKKNILVFPCGSEVALEIHRSLRYSAHFNLVGASSVDDHGRFVFKNYISNLPFYDDKNFIEFLSEVIREHKIDAIYPAMDSVAKLLKKHEEELGCIVIGSNYEVTETVSSKNMTYKLLSNVIPCPKWVIDLKDVSLYPVFLKPDQGYGSRNIKLAHSKLEAENFIENKKEKYVYCEYLPGKEYTIDCFSDRKGNLLFSGSRERVRVSNGISVSTYAAKEHNVIFKEIAEKINSTLLPRGAWFFQMKENDKGQPTLLEVAARLGGSSSYFRAKGVNFAMLSAFDAFEYDVAVHTNDYDVELDRALDNKYKIDIEYQTIYVDFDDCILINDKINTKLVGFLYQSINDNIRIVLLTRHSGNIIEKLESLKISPIFDEIIHLRLEELKSDFIKKETQPIFIDDSYAERLDVSLNLNIPVFSPDMIEALLK